MEKKLNPAKLCCMMNGDKYRCPACGSELCSDDAVITKACYRCGDWTTEKRRRVRR